MQNYLKTALAGTALSLALLATVLISIFFIDDFPYAFEKKRHEKCFNELSAKAEKNIIDLLAAGRQLAARKSVENALFDFRLGIPVRAVPEFNMPGIFSNLRLLSPGYGLIFSLHPDLPFFAPRETGIMTYSAQTGLLNLLLDIVIEKKTVGRLLMEFSPESLFAGYSGSFIDLKSLLVSGNILFFNIRDNSYIPLGDLIKKNSGKNGIFPVRSGKYSYLLCKNVAGADIVVAAHFILPAGFSPLMIALMAASFLAVIFFITAVFIAFFRQKKTTENYGEQIENRTAENNNTDDFQSADNAAELPRTESAYNPEEDEYFGSRQAFASREMDSDFLGIIPAGQKTAREADHEPVLDIIEDEETIITQEPDEDSGEEPFSAVENRQLKPVAGRSVKNPLPPPAASEEISEIPDEIFAKTAEAPEDDLTELINEINAPLPEAENSGTIRSLIKNFRQADLHSTDAREILNWLGAEYENIFKIKISGAAVLEEKENTYIVSAAENVSTAFQARFRIPSGHPAVKKFLLQKKIIFIRERLEESRFIRERIPRDDLEKFSSFLVLPVFQNNILKYIAAAGF